MKKNYLNFLCIVVSLIMLCVGCDGNKTSSSDPLEIKKATEFVLQGYQFDGTGVKSLDKIVLYSDNTSHIEGVWANGRHFTWNGKWRIVTDSYHDKAYRAIGFEYSAADGYAYIMENYDFYFSEYHIKHKGIPDGKMVKRVN